MSEATNGCVKVRSLLEAYFEDVLPPKQERMVAEHLWQCPQCAVELEQIRRLALALESLPALEPAEGLLTAISARLDTLPAPTERRRVLIGWRRLGEVAGLAMAVLAALIYAVGPAAHLTGSGGAHRLAQAAAVLAHWTAEGRHALHSILPVLHGLSVAIADLGRAVAPTVGIYASAELALVVGVALVLRGRHLHTVASSRVGVRRS